VGFGVFLLAAARFAWALSTRTPEEEKKAAYEQLEGRTFAGTQAPPAVRGYYGTKRPPATTRSALPARPLRAVHAPTTPSLQRLREESITVRRPAIMGRLAEQGLGGILLSALAGLGIGGGLAYFTSRMGRREEES